MKPKLAKIQNDFLEALYQQMPHPSCLSHIQSGQKLSSSERFSIYKGSIVGALTKSLRDIYGVCKKLVGEDFFHGLAYTYIETTPSQSPDLGEYGEGFASFIESFPPVKHLPYLADICRLCWAWHQAYRHESHAPFDIEAFAKLTDVEQENVVLCLPQSAQCLSSCYPIDSIWEMCLTKEPNEIVMHPTTTYLMVFRDGAHIKIDKMTHDEWLLAQLLMVGAPLALVMQHMESANIDVAALLPLFLQRGWLAGWQLLEKI
jgi:hypothetical protein